MTQMTEQELKVGLCKLVRRYTGFYADVFSEVVSGIHDFYTKQAGYVLLDEDQSLPIQPYTGVNVAAYYTEMDEEKAFAMASSYLESQQDMLATNFKKIRRE